MRLIPAGCIALTTTFLLPALGHAQAAMTDAHFIKMAEAGAPAAISTKAAVIRIDGAKKTTAQVRAGSNGFTCSVIPDESQAPFCGDANAWAWFDAAFTGKPKPTNPAPGISYMAQGGIHYEMPNGDIVMEAGPGTKSVGEPPHWMLMWAFDPSSSGLPTKPNPSGVYIMFAGTPYAHLMVYQNPNTMK